MNKEYCNDHECVKNELKHVNEDIHEIKHAISQIREDITKLSTHEKIYIAFIGFCGVALSAGGSVLGVLLTKMWQ